MTPTLHILEQPDGTMKFVYDNGTERREWDVTEALNKLVADTKQETRREFKDQFRIYLDGDQWCAVGPGFVDLQATRAGFGHSPLTALVQLLGEVRNSAAIIDWDNLPKGDVLGHIRLMPHILEVARASEGFATAYQRVVTHQDRVDRHEDTWECAAGEKAAADYSHWQETLAWAVINMQRAAMQFGLPCLGVSREPELGVTQPYTEDAPDLENVVLFQEPRADAREDN